MIGLLSILLASALQVIPAGPSYLSQKSLRDTVHIADKVEYGFELKDVARGTEFDLPDIASSLDKSLELSSGWKEQVLRESKKEGLQVRDLRMSVILQPFDEKEYELPQLNVLRRNPDGTSDTLCFDPARLLVSEIPIDTAKFTIHDIKNQDVLQTTFADILEDGFPWVMGIAGVALLALAVFFVVRMVIRRRSRMTAPAEPAHVVALRELEKYRNEKYWVDDKQKVYYSGITDALRGYIAARFGIDAVEMTTSDIFAALKDEDSLPQELYLRTRDLFELADFVKFAKHLASREENAAAIPTAVQFVTTAYQAELSADAQKTNKEEAR